jgi:hypothetical protein
MPCWITFLESAGSRSLRRTSVSPRCMAAPFLRGDRGTARPWKTRS